MPLPGKEPSRRGSGRVGVLRWSRLGLTSSFNPRSPTSAFVSSADTVAAIIAKLSGRSQPLAPLLLARVKQLQQPILDAHWVPRVILKDRRGACLRGAA